MLVECTHCNYNVSFCISGFFSPFLSNCVSSYGLCIYNPVFGLVHCIPLYCCDTTPTSSAKFTMGGGLSLPIRSFVTDLLQSEGTQVDHNMVPLVDKSGSRDNKKSHSLLSKIISKRNECSL